MKKILSVLLVAVMLLTAAPLSGFVGLELPAIDLSAAFAPQADAATSGNYTYSVSDGKATITDVDTSISGSVTIPSKLGGYPVVSIGNYAFSRCDSLTSITIPSGVTSIGERAFYHCTGLTSITIPSGVTSIGSYAFFYCTRLTSITIPDSVTSIGNYAFYNCTGLTSITVAAGNGYYSSDSYGVLFNKNKTILIQYPCGNTRSAYVIPSSVTSIGSSAFYWCDNLTSITIPDSVTSIGISAFAGCDSLTSITIPDSVTSIGSYAFPYCDSLTSITIPDSVTSISNYAFYNCTGLTSITIPVNVTAIGMSAFEKCTALDSVVVFNSGCSIYDSETTFPENATLFGSAGSHLQAYAEKYNRTFSELVCAHALTESIPKVAATCTKTGLKTTVCVTCKDVLDEETIPINPDNHVTWNETVKDLTCTEPGLLTRICAACKKTETEAIAALGHDEISHAAQAATCLTVGWETYVTCSRCDHSTYAEIPALGHAAGEVITTHNNMTVQYCTRNPEHIYSEKTAYLRGDIDGDGTIASIDARGALRFSVGLDEPTEQQFTSADMNQNGKMESSDARSILRISVGLDTLENNTVTPETYEYRVDYTAATCTVDGKTDIICLTCNDVVSSTLIEKTGHSYTKAITKQPTCTSDGFEKTVCESCGDVKSEKFLAATGHSYSSSITKQATCRVTGVRTYTCNYCSDSYTETISKTAHTYSSYYYCTGCQIIQPGYEEEFLNSYLRRCGSRTSNGNYYISFSLDGGRTTHYLMGDGSSAPILQSHYDCGDGYTIITAFEISTGSSSEAVGVVEYSSSYSTIAEADFTFNPYYFTEYTTISFDSYSGLSSIKSDLASRAADMIYSSVLALSIYMIGKGYNMTAEDLGFANLD